VVYGKINGRPTIGTRTLLARTCAKCRILRQGRSFSFTGTSYVNVCSSCKNKARKKKGPRIQPGTHSLKDQLKSNNTAVRKQEIYTDRDADLIVKLHNEGKTYLEIAQIMGRTVYGINNAITRFALRQSKEWR
jgi:hypothetical protein